MGKCLTIVKLVGIGSLGITTGVLSYSSTALVPQLLDYIRTNYLINKEDLQQLSKRLVHLTRRCLIGFGLLSTYLFGAAFKSASLADRHPYLIYSAIGLPIAGGYYAHKVLPFEFSLLKSIASISEASPKTKGSSGKPKTETRVKKVKKLVKQKKQPEPSPLDNSVYNDLGDAESEEIEVEEEVEYEVPIEEEAEESSTADEVQLSLVRNECENSLLGLQKQYFTTAIISGTTLALALVGFAGESFLL